MTSFIALTECKSFLPKTITCIDESGMSLFELIMV